MKKYYVVVIVLFYFLTMPINSDAGQLHLNRSKVIEYVKEHCGTGTPPDTGYNHQQYKCYNGQLPECENYGSGRQVDCANFASQALIDGFGGGNPFGCVKNATTIGKDGFSKGQPSVSELKDALSKSFCFKEVHRLIATAGDILSHETVESPAGCGACCRNSHVTVYAGDSYTGEGGDCTNFVSQALVAGGLTNSFLKKMCTGFGVPCWDSNNPGGILSCSGCVDEKGMIIRPNPFPAILERFYCAQVTNTIPSNLEKGDVIVMGKNSEREQNLINSWREL